MTSVGYGPELFGVQLPLGKPGAFFGLIYERIQYNFFKRRAAKALEQPRYRGCLYFRTLALALLFWFWLDHCFHNTLSNYESRGISTGFGFLRLGLRASHHHDLDS